MNAPGKGMLKVVSILFIVFGAIATLVSLIGLFGSAVLAAATYRLAGILVVAMVIALISSVLELIVGIIGLKRCEDPAQSGFFIVTGIILCALMLISLIMSFSFMSLIGFVLPILFIVGGMMNKNASSSIQA